MMKHLLFLFILASFWACSPHLAKQDIGKTQEEVSENETLSKTERLLVYNAHLDLVVKNPDTLKTYFFTLAEKYEGYVQKFSNNQAILRVKSNFLDNTLGEIAQLGKLKRKEVVGNDVTDEYRDFKIRLDNAEQVRQRYLALLDKAKNIEEIMKVEVELARISTEIDLMKGKIKAMDNQIQYATVYVNIQKKIQPSVLGYVFIGLYEGVKRLFVWN